MITPHQARILDMALDGLSNKQIAAVLTMTVNGVKCLMFRAYYDLAVHSRPAALAKWRILHPPPPEPKPEKKPAPRTWEQNRAAIIAATDHATHKYTGKPAPVVERAEQLELM